MLLQSNNWIHGYNQIMTDCRPSSNPFSGNCGTVLILCNPDADALCAARILSYILRADNIPYQLRPCGGMRKLVSILESLNLYSSSSSAMYGGDDTGESEFDFDPNQYDDDNNANQFGSHSANNSAIRAIVLLNLGATKNLNTTLYSPRPVDSSFAKNGLQSDDEEDDEDGRQNDENRPTFKSPLVSRQIKTFVLDSHRPYHLANIHAGKNIVIWNDYDHWHLEDGGIPSDGDGLSGDEDEEDEETDEDESEEDSENDEEDSDEGEAEFEDSDDEGNHDDPQSDIEEDNTEKSKSLKRDSADEESDNESLRNKRPRREEQDAPDTEGTTDDEDDDEISDKDSQDINNQNTSNNKNTIQSIREQYQARRKRIQTYYDNGSFRSSPVSYMAYDLSTKLRHSSVGDLLWLACIGVSDAYIHNRLELSGYIKISMLLQDRVKETYDDSDYQYGENNSNDDDRMQILNNRLTNTFYAEDLYTGNNDGDYEGGGNSMDGTNQRYNGPMTQVGFSENGKILIQKDEFRFFLLRHVSLWDAMVLSSEVNTKMELWKSKGIKRLKEMLAKMGLPLSQCQQPYAFVKPALKRRLKLMIMEHAEEYGLDNLSYTGFIRVTGYKSLLSASDVAFAVTALLECESKYRRSGAVKDGSNSNIEGELTPNPEEEEELALLSAFNTAYDALNSNASSVNLSGGLGSSIINGEGSDLSSLVNGGDTSASSNGIGAGLRLAVSLQSAIVTTAMGMVERKAITRLSHFRYAYLHATSQGANGGTNFKTGAVTSNRETNHNRSHNQHIFSKPLALTKLALFLMDMHRANNKWTGTKARPLILLAEKPQTQTYLVVGYEFPEERGTVKKNKFEKKFQLATETMQGSFKFDSFESNVVEVKSSEVQKFVEHLHYMIDSV